MEKNIKADILLNTEEVVRILTVTAVIQLGIDGCYAEEDINLLRGGAKAVSEHAQHPILLEIFDTALAAQKALVIPLDEVKDHIRKRQAWRAGQYLTALAETQKAPEALVVAAKKLQDFWGTEPVASWYTIDNLMRA